MQRNEILEKVQDVFRDVFDDEELIIYEEIHPHMILKIGIRLQMFNW